MPGIPVLVVGGTGESSATDTRTEVTGLLAGVTDALDERFHPRWVPYPASYGPVPRLSGLSYERSVSEGASRLRSVIAATRDPYLVIGYSQGCAVIRRALATGVATEPLGVGMVADPYQPPGAVRGCAGRGVAGVGEAIGDDVPVMWIADPRDAICNASADSLLRDVADLTRAFSFADGRRWLIESARAVTSGAMQNAAVTAFSPRQWARDVGRLRTAAREVAGYLPATIAVGSLVVANVRGGRHEAYRHETLPDSTDLTGCAALAAWLQVVATVHIGPRQSPVVAARRSTSRHVNTSDLGETG